MKKYFEYLLVLSFVLFSLYYTDKVIELSNYNDVIRTSINDYASITDRNCIEGKINEKGIVLGFDGLKVNKNKSYSNMKGIGFKEELVEYDKEKCILNREDNLDKYIVSGNTSEKRISLVIDIDSLKYYKKMYDIASHEKVTLNYLISYNAVDKFDIKDNILLKTNVDNIKKFKKKVKSFYCVKYYKEDILEYCKKEKINSINILNYVFNDLLFAMKDSLSPGEIYFIKENESNYLELDSTIKYIKSRGYNIISVDELLS